MSLTAALNIDLQSQVLVQFTNGRLTILLAFYRDRKVLASLCTGKRD